MCHSIDFTWFDFFQFPFDSNLKFCSSYNYVVWSNRKQQHLWITQISWLVHTYIVHMSLKIPWLERNHRDAVFADRINRSCLGGNILYVCVRLSLQISLSYAIFIIFCFSSSSFSFPFLRLLRLLYVCICMPHQVPKAWGATLAISHVHSIFDGCWNAQRRIGAAGVQMSWAAAEHSYKWYDLYRRLY